MGIWFPGQSYLLRTFNNYVLLQILLLLLYIIWRVQPCGYDAFIYRLRTPGPISLLRFFFSSAYNVVRSSSFVSGFVRFSCPNVLA